MKRDSSFLVPSALSLIFFVLNETWSPITKATSRRFVSFQDFCLCWASRRYFFASSKATSLTPTKSLTEGTQRVRQDYNLRSLSLMMMYSMETCDTYLCNTHMWAPPLVWGALALLTIMTQCFSISPYVHSRLQCTNCQRFLDLTNMQWAP